MINIYYKMSDTCYPINYKIILAIIIIGLICIFLLNYIKKEPYVSIPAQCGPNKNKNIDNKNKFMCE